MQERFKKNKQNWMEDFMRAVSARNILRQPLDPPDPSKPNRPLFTPKTFKQYSFQSKGTDKIINPPQLLLTIDPQLIPDILDQTHRSRKTIQACLLADSPDSPFTRLQELSSEDDQDLGNLQDSKDAFCIGLAIVKEDGYTKTQQRVQYEFRCLSERSGAKYKLQQQTGRLFDIWKVLGKLVRIFILAEQRQKMIKIGRLIFYPKVDISLRLVRITPFSFVDNPVMSKFKSMNLAKQACYGYISLSNVGNNNFKFILIQPAELENNKIPLVGVFLAGKLGRSLQKDTLLWSIIVQYLINPLIANRLSLKGDRTGILVHFDENNKSVPFLFQIPVNIHWNISTSVDCSNTFPSEHKITAREVIMQEQKEQSQVESVQSRPNFVEYPPDCFSSKSHDERDSQIAVLRSQVQSFKIECAKLRQTNSELEYYKAECSQLRKKLAAMSVQKSLSYQMTSVPTAVSPDHQQLYSVHSNWKEAQKEPNFGRDLNHQPSLNQTKFKDTKVKDFSFAQAAQENSIEEQYNGQNLLASSIEEGKFLSPSFNHSGHFNHEVRPFQDPRPPLQPSTYPSSSMNKSPPQSPKSPRMDYSQTEPPRHTNLSGKKVDNKYFPEDQREMPQPQYMKRVEKRQSEPERIERSVASIEINALTKKYSEKAQKYTLDKESPIKNRQSVKDNRKVDEFRTKPRKDDTKAVAHTKVQVVNKKSPDSKKMIKQLNKDSDSQQDEEFIKIMRERMMMKRI